MMSLFASKDFAPLQFTRQGFGNIVITIDLAYLTLRSSTLSRAERRYFPSSGRLRVCLAFVRIAIRLLLTTIESLGASVAAADESPLQMKFAGG